MMLLRTVPFALPFLIASAAAAQIVPPPPPAPEKPAPYTPPTPPPPVVQAPPPRPEPEPEGPLPSLVKHDDKGRLVAIDANAEEAAVGLLELDDAARASVDKALAEHHAEMDRRVIENAGVVIEMYKARQRPDSLGDIGELQNLARSLAPVRPTSVLDRLVRSGAITSRQRLRADQIVKGYKDAVTADAAKEAGDNIQAVIKVSGRQAFLDVSGDAARSFERLTAAAAVKMESLLASPDLKLTTEQQAKVKAKLEQTNSLRVAGPEKDRLRAEALRTLCLEVLSAEQVGTMLKSANPELFAEKQAESKRE